MTSKVKIKKQKYRIPQGMNIGEYYDFKNWLIYEGLLPVRDMKEFARNPEKWKKKYYNDYREINFG